MSDDYLAADTEILKKIEGVMDSSELTTCDIYEAFENIQDTPNEEKTVDTVLSIMEIFLFEEISRESNMAALIFATFLAGAKSASYSIADSTGLDRETLYKLFIHVTESNECGLLDKPKFNTKNLHEELKQYKEDEEKLINNLIR